MPSSTVFDIQLEAEMPPSVTIRSSTIHGGEALRVVLDDRTTECQRGLVFRRGVESSLSIPDTIRGYALLLNAPVLIIEVVVPNDSAWLLFQWDEARQRAGSVVIALGPDNTESLFAMRIKKATEQAISLYGDLYG